MNPGLRCMKLRPFKTLFSLSVVSLHICNAFTMAAMSPSITTFMCAESYQSAFCYQVEHISHFTQGTGRCKTNPKTVYAPNTPDPKPCTQVESPI